MTYFDDNEETSMITVTVDMANDLALANQGPRFSDAYRSAEQSNDGEALQAIEDAHDAYVARLTDEWIAAAQRIGESWGYEVDAHGMTAGDPRGEWTRTPNAEVPEAWGYDTVEEALWQLAHEATMNDA